ncbi:centrosomal protein of 70 kDa isoform X3 [Onychostruthus taczanowskii]|uniref:centrosomal protein of 70 kDa isoform X3 n=1 Tax=Onychostruthus taczanowskii TaxID=356909 RepID=UPI001B801BD3|nr:centrosomal protein of 70 kDa isoform X3 [Onychostruthus taczanowskii]
MTEQEKAEWENLNRILMRHGLKPVSLAAPQSCRDTSDMIVLDHQSSQGIRLALKTLVEDTERQQKVMQGLMEANRCLRDVVRLEQGRASRQEQRANDLEIVVKNIKAKICQLEDETIAKACQQQNQVKELQKEQQASRVKYQQQQEKLQEQEEIIARLQKELSRVGREEQQRADTQNKMFCQFCKRAPKSVLDQRQYKKDEDEVQREVKNKEEFLNLDATPNYKALLMSFQKQLTETKAKNEQLLLENISLKKNLEISRPTAQELKFYKHQVKKLQKALKKTDQFSGSRTGEKKEENKDSGRVARVDQLQAACQQYLQVLSHIDSILQSPRAPPLIFRPSKGPMQNYTKENGQGCGFEHLPLTVEMWADQLIALKDLHRSLRKLSLELLPWNTKDPQDHRESIRVEDLQLIVDAILEELEHKEKNSQTQSLQTLSAIVCHFQKLFDVNSVNGVYPRMNEVYIKLGEMTNAMRNLHELLELDSSAPPTVVVDTVGKLCDIINKNVTEQVQQLLGTQDIHSIITKLEEHECFFPPFQALIQDLLCLLEISNVDDILPAVQNLKWGAGSG